MTFIFFEPSFWKQNVKESINMHQLTISDLFKSWTLAPYCCLFYFFHEELCCHVWLTANTNKLVRKLNSDFLNIFCELNPFRPIAATYLTKLFNSITIHNSPAARAREVFKPSTDSASLLVPTQKKKFFSGLGTPLGDVTSGGVLAFLWPTLPGPRRQYNESIFAQVLFGNQTIIRVFERLIDFLAYLEPKLCRKKQKVVKIPTPSNTNLGCITPSLYMAITRCQNRLESRSSP